VASTEDRAAPRAYARAVGLDTYASRGPGDVSLSTDDERAFGDAHVELCGGMYSGEGGSFRGKVYEDVVLEVTGVGLYQQWIAPDEVARMAAALEACDPEQVARADGRVAAGEVRSLAMFFRVCADRGLGLIGWW
jgi:hypothetical protein